VTRPVANRLAAASAVRYGQDCLEVELDLQAAAERITGPRPARRDHDEGVSGDRRATANAAGGASADRTVTGPQLPRQPAPAATETCAEADAREDAGLVAMATGVSADDN